MNEVSITPNDYSYLYDLVAACRKSASDVSYHSKAYYELKSYLDDEQLELVEGYYNIDAKGYQLTDLHLKAGRLAVRPVNKRFFVSLSSSRAFLLLNIFKSNRFFPVCPMELRRSRLKRRYFLQLEDKYLDNNKDSIYVISYIPKDTSGNLFRGKLWINKSHQQLRKITLHCDHAQIHPFTPIFSSEKIIKVDLSITQTFGLKDGYPVPHQSDFNYTILYSSDRGDGSDQNFVIHTDAIMYSYSESNLFKLPYFSLKDSIDDYRKINAMPYNEFFWSFNDEYRMNSSTNINDRFFNDSLSLTNQSIFKPNKLGYKGLFEHPFVQWSKDRITMREIMMEEKTDNVLNPKFKSDLYNLSVKLFVDVNHYQDSTNILTATIFDPYETFFYLPMDRQTYFFINVYFDLCEIKRRESVDKLFHQSYSNAQIKNIYDVFMVDFELFSKQYFDEVVRGTRKDEMIKYNNMVIEKLGIDNLAIFLPYEED